MAINGPIKDQIETSLEALRKLETQATELQRKLNHETGFTINALSVVVSIGLPLVEAALPKPENVMDFQAIGLWLVVALFHLWLAIYVIKATSGLRNLNNLSNWPHFLQMRENIENYITVYDRALNLLNDQAVISLSLIAWLKTSKSASSKTAALKNFLTVLDSVKSHLGFEKTDWFNMGIYLYDSATKTLSTSEGLRIHNIPKKSNTGRVIPSNDGIVGVTHDKKRIYILENIRDHESLVRFQTDRDSDFDDDCNTYTSSFSIPFGEDGKNPVGVFIITSNRRGHFSEKDYKKFGEFVQTILTILYS